MASFETLIQANKRNTTVLMVVVTLVLCALASVIALLIVGVSSGEPEDDLYSQASYRQAPPMWQSVAFASGVALVVAFVLILFANYGGAGTLLSISRAREIVKADDPQLFNVVEEMCVASNMPLPRIFVIEDTAPNAFATGRDPAHAVVAITTGLRSKLSRDELQAVMAHELSHIRNYDIRLAMFAAIMVGLIVLLADMLLRYFWWGGGGRRSRSDRDSGGLQIVIVVVGVLLAVLAPIFARMLQLALGRQREYLADASAAEMTRYPEALASALAKIDGDQEVLEVANRATSSLYIVNPFKPHETRFKSASYGSTHPPTEDRIKRLMAIGRSE